MRRSRLALALATLLAASLVGSGLAQDWPHWRGPTGMGHTTLKNLPLTWGVKNNIRWKVPLFDAAAKAKPDQNQSSPVVRNGRVFITLSYWPAKVNKNQFPEHHVVCFRAEDGRRLWDTAVPPGPWLLNDLRGGYTAPTPAVDADRVYVVFGSSVLAALDLDGKLLWRKEITPHEFDVAFATSPVLYRDLVLVMCEQMAHKKASVLLALDRKTGILAWKKNRPDADWTHSTPVIATINGKPQLLVAAATAVQGLNPDNGDILWTCKTGQRTGDTVSPVYGKGLVYCDSGRGGAGVAVDPTGHGDVTATHLKWKLGQVPAGFSSPVIVGDYLYRVHEPGILKCWEMTSGKKVYAERLEGVSTSASPIATADGRLYFASAGRSYVIQAGPKFRVLAVNDLGDNSSASPAVAEGRIYLKGTRYLYCIGRE